MIMSASRPRAPGATTELLPGTRVLATPPQGAEIYVHATPRWLLWVVRVAFAVFALVLGGLTWHDWAQMPAWARLLSLTLSPALLGLSAWPTVWRSTAKFVASREGVAFPSNEQLVLRFGRPVDEAWLFVPWACIGNLRLSKSVGDHSVCVAFDLQISTAERERFFGHVASPVDCKEGEPSVLRVAYDDSPPAPRRTLERLSDLKARA